MPPTLRRSEPLRTTLLRTGGIALIAGALLARSMGGLKRWPILALVVFCFTFGGHWVELWFLNWLRPRIPAARSVQMAARIIVWFVGGLILGLGAQMVTVLAAYRPAQWPTWWVMGVGFVGLELVVHLLLRLRGRPSFYDGRA